MLKHINKIKGIWTKSNRWHRVLFLFLLVECGLVPSGQQGFYCNDPSLSHKYTGDTVNFKWLFGLTAFVPLIVMLVVERQINKDTTDRGKGQVMLWYKEYLFGLLVNLTICHILKQLVGAPRPHFFDTCSPMEATTCEGSEYVSSYTCTKAHWLKQSDKSFPSGHTSLSVHAAAFIIWYMYRRGARHAGAVCSAAAGAAALCAASRVRDGRHHARDVLAGGMLAAPVLVYTIILLCKNFKCILSPETCKESASADKQTDKIPDAPSNMSERGDHADIAPKIINA